MTIGSVSCEPVTIPNSAPGHWIVIRTAAVPLRCWWAQPLPGGHDFDVKSTPNRIVLVLPEVFGVNGWVRSVTERLAAQGCPALAMPLFARTAPELELGYAGTDLVEGRRHKEATTTEQILMDVAAAIAWLRQRHPEADVSVVGFCFGGHAALLAATHPEVVSSFDFYGAGVSRMRPGGGAPSLTLLPQVKGQLTCLCGTADPLIPPEERQAIRTALQVEDPDGERLRYVEFDGADHGFMCEARSSFNPDAANRGWQLLLDQLSA